MNFLTFLYEKLFGVNEKFINVPQTLKVQQVVNAGTAQAHALPANNILRQSQARRNVASQMGGQAPRARAIIAGDVIEPYCGAEHYRPKQSQKRKEDFNGCNMSSSTPVSMQMNGINPALPANNVKPAYMANTDQITDQIEVGVSDPQVNSYGEIQQPIIYDRFIYANQRSRNYGAGDPIRGDLPIVPNCNDWMRPIANPQTDLRDGALMSMFGNGSNTYEMLALRSASTGGLLNPGGGNNTIIANNPYTPGMVQKNISLSQSGGVHVSSFP